MKKILLFTFVLCSFASIVYAQGALTSRLGPSIVHRNSITTADTSYPTVTTNAFDCAGYTHVRVFAEFTGTTVNATPLIWESSGSKFYPGTATTITVDTYYDIEVDQGPYVYMYLDTMTAATVTIYLQGIEQRGY